MVMRLVTAASTAAIWAFVAGGAWIALTILLALSASGEGHAAGWQMAISNTLNFPVRAFGVTEPGSLWAAALLTSAWIFVPGMLLVLLLPHLDAFYYTDEDDPLVYRVWPIAAYVLVGVLVNRIDARAATIRETRDRDEAAVKKFAAQQPRIADLAKPDGHIFLSATLQAPPGVLLYEIYVSQSVDRSSQFAFIEYRLSAAQDRFRLICVGPMGSNKMYAAPPPFEIDPETCLRR